MSTVRIILFNSILRLWQNHLNEVYTEDNCFLPIQKLLLCLNRNEKVGKLDRLDAMFECIYLDRHHIEKEQSEQLLLWWWRFLEIENHFNKTQYEGALE
jgi:hypothetical protein